MADLGKGLGGGARPPLFWVKKENITEVRKADRACKQKNLHHHPFPPAPPLAQGLDPPLVHVSYLYSIFTRFLVRCLLKRKLLIGCSSDTHDSMQFQGIDTAITPTRSDSSLSLISFK